MILKNYDLAFENWRFLLDKWNDMLQIQSTYFSVHFQYAFLKYVAYLQSTYLKEKIRIGFKLKSAEVKTLVSRRYSENSSHTHSHLHKQAHAYSHTHTWTHKHTPVDKAYPCILGHTHTLKHTPRNTWAHQWTQSHTIAHPHTLAPPHKHLCTPHTYPLMPLMW